MTVRVAYVIENQLDRRDYERNGVSAMVALGAEVDVIDVTRVTRPHFVETRTLTDSFPGITIHTVAGPGALGAQLANLRRADIVFVYVGFTGSPRALTIYRLLAKAGRPYCVFATNAYPGHTRHAGDIRKIGSRVRNIAERLLAGQIDPVRSILFRLPPQVLGVVPPAFIVHGGRGSHAAGRMYPVGPQTRRIHAHSQDYDIFRRERDAAPVEAEPLAVFIDENMGFQRDFQDLGLEPPTTVEAYYPRLRRLFDRIEAETGLTVVIAANPRSDYSSMPELFGHRRIEYGVTARLIARSRLVIGHRSTAIGFAVMFRRPMAMLATDSIYRHFVNTPVYDSFREALGTHIRFFDDPESTDLADLERFDAAAYDRYMAEYVKMPDSPDAPFWDIIATELSRAGIALPSLASLPSPKPGIMP